MPLSTCHLQTYPTATPFLAKMRPLLEANEARNGLMLGIALRAETDPHFYGSDPYFATAADANGIVVAALMTPPHGVILYCDRDPADQETINAALQALADNLQADSWPVPTVQGPTAVAHLFAQIWATLTGITYQVATELRVFALHQVIHPSYSPGHLRQATLADLALAIQWFQAFEREIHLGEADFQDEERLHKVITQRIADGYLYFWEHEQPVSMAGLTRPTARGITIGPVYTPPEQRGHGYASSAVARLSQQMLAAGKEFCALFTDLANPTSNHIYQQIGYQALGDFTLYRFVATH